MADEQNLQEGAWLGIQLCRAGAWREGLERLRSVAESVRPGAELPGLFYSYLGYGIARYRRQYREGLALCQHAIKVEFYQPENYANLARTCLLMSRRRQALEVVERGLAIDPHSPQLQAVREEMGTRRRPVLPFIPRANPVNRQLGKFRHRLLYGPQDSSDE